MHKKNNLILLIALTCLLSSCHFTNTSSSLGEDSSSSSVFVDMQDPYQTKPVYDGNDVLISQIVTNDYRSYIEVEGQPFLFTGAQIRVDALMNCDHFTYEQIKPLFYEAHNLGVTCVQIPLEWSKIESDEDQFDFTYIHQMLLFAMEYDLKVEFLWYGSNMCGDSHSYTVPNYILKDGKTYPKLDATRTGEFWNYYGIMWFLDFDHENLIARERNALSKVMDYIYEWDSTHGGKKIVIGMQILNEPDIFVRWRIYQQDVLSNITHERMSEEEGYAKINHSLNELGKAVKESHYKVYTRVNFASSTGSDYNGNANGIYNGEIIKEAPSFVKNVFDLEGIDLVGDDSYTSSIKNIKGITTMYSENLSGNFAHIAENDGSYGNSASLILAAISQYGGYCLYDLITSPFFVKNNSANIDQGIMTFRDETYSSFVYKSHYQQTQSILKGLKMAGNSLFEVTKENFACFNIKNDTARPSITQQITTDFVGFSFESERGAIGFALSKETEINLYMSEEATINMEHVQVQSIETGYYQNDIFIPEQEIQPSATLQCKKDTFYRIKCTYDGTVLASTTFENIGS